MVLRGLGRDDLRNRSGRATEAAAQSTADETASAARLSEMKTWCDPSPCSATPGPTAHLWALRRPVLRYNDPARRFEDGTVWVFGQRGRPLAVLKTEILTQNQDICGIVWLLPDPDLGARRPRAGTGPRPGRESSWYRSPTSPPAVRLGTRPAHSDEGAEPAFLRPRGQRPGFGKIAVLPCCPSPSTVTPTRRPVFKTVRSSACRPAPTLTSCSSSSRSGSRRKPRRAGRMRSHAWEERTSPSDLDNRVVWSRPAAPIPSTLETYMNRLVPRVTLVPEPSPAPK